MKLRTKTYLALGLTSATLVAVLIALFYLLVMDGYSRLEQRQAIDGALRAAGSLASDVDALNGIAGEWAMQDATYAFLEDPAQNQVLAHLTAPMLVENRLQFLVIVDTTGHIRYCIAVEAETGTETELPLGLSPHLTMYDRLVRHTRPASRVAGPILLAGQAAIVASRPIVPAESGKPVAGAIIIGRFIDRTALDRLEQTHSAEIRLLPFAEDAALDTAMPDVGRARQRFLESAAPVAATLDGETIAGYALLHSIYGERALILRSSGPRSIWHQGLHTYWWLMMALAVLGLSFALTASGVMDRFVLRRMLVLENRVRGIRAGGDLSARVSLAGNDELARLARSIDGMLEGMEVSQSSLLIRERQQQAAQLLEELPVYAYLKDLSGRFVTANRRFRDALGIAAAEIAVKRTHDVLPRELADRTTRDESYVMETGTPLERDDDYFIDRGRRIEVATRLVPQLTDDGRLTGIVGLKFDISERKAAERALVEEKERAEVTLHSIGDAVMTTDSSGRVIYMNPAARALVGGTGTSIMHTTVDALLPLVWEHNGEPADNLVRRCLQERRRVHRGTHVLVRFEDGREYTVQDSASPLLDPAGEPVGAVLVLHDVTAMHTITRQLEFQATHDPLTGLLNRRAFETHLQQVLGHATGSPPCALLYLDLDNFKIVNDTSGHEAGDELLRHVAQVLQSRVRTSDVVARLGGDEFGIVLESCEIGRAELIAESVRRDLGHHRFSWDHQRFDLTASIGVVPVGSAGLCLSDVLRAADSACYVAKEGGRNRVHVFQPDDQDLARRRSEMHWIQRISAALDDERFCLYGQAIVPLTTSGERPPMTELLLRMVGEEGEVISPGTFVPAAERYCFMPQVDRWVVKTALRELGSLRLPRDRRYAINLSGQSISDPGFLEFVCEHMVLNQVEGSNLCFELTETAAVANLACASRFMHALRERGCRFALDDFGSGMSSFGYLRDLPVDFIKIDGEFVRHIASDPIEHALVRAINDIAHLLGCRTIAEYVENAALCDLLRADGVDYVQGYAIHTPEPLLCSARDLHQFKGTRSEHATLAATPLVV